MLLAFKNNQIPKIPPPLINVRDSETDLSIPVAAIQGDNESIIQAQSLAYGPLNMSDEVSLSSGLFSKMEYCPRKSKVLISLVLPTATKPDVCFLKMVDFSGIEILFQHDISVYLASITGVPVSNGTNYGVLVYDLYGAHKVSVSFDADTIVRIATV